MNRLLTSCLYTGLVLWIAWPISSPGGGAKPDKLELSKGEQSILDLTNAERKKANLPPVKPNAKLFQAARAYSAKMVKHQKTDHYLEGSTLKERIKATGYSHAFAGENLAKGFGEHTPDTVVEGWMNSPSHRKMILEEKFVEIGLGLVPDDKGNVWYTQVFAKPQ